MHILIVHQYFLNQGEAGGSRWNQFAKYWADAGHRVSVVAGSVSYQTGQKLPKYRGKFIVQEEADTGVHVYRCYVSESYNRGFLGRAWAYASFSFSAGWAGRFRVERPDVIVASSPPLTVGPTLRRLKRYHRVPALFEIRDLWPESAIDTGVLASPLLIRRAYRMEAQAYRTADWINVLTPAFKDALIEKKGIPAEKISMIPNGADLDIMKPGPKENEIRRKLGLNGKFVVSYFGAHGRANRVGQLLNVAERIQGSMPDVRIMLVGDGMERPGLIEAARERGLGNVVFVDAVRKDDVGDYINASDVCTAVLMKNDTFTTVYPNKVFDYMSCKRPIILAIDGVARKLVEDAGAGLFAEPENPDAFIDCISRLRAAPETCRLMGEAGYAHVVERYSRKALAQEYLKVLEKLVRGR